MKGLRVVISLLSVIFFGLLPDPGQAAPGDISTIAGTATAGFSGDGGAATAASLKGPYGMVKDGAGNIYIADTVNNRVRKVDAGTGYISTIAGTGSAAFSGDGGPATDASLNTPRGLALDSAGNLYIADKGNNRIRMVDAATKHISTVAGNATGGYSGDGVAATTTSLKGPSGVALDNSGNLYIADTSNHRIRMVDTGTPRIISTVAGIGTATPVSGVDTGDNGPAMSATLNFPMGVALDSAGNLYIADTFNNIIREIIDGAIFAVAGSGSVGSQETLAHPYGVAVDMAGNLFIADTSNQRVLKVARVTLPRATDIATSLNTPSGVAVDSTGNLYIADQGNNRILKVETSLPVVTASPIGGTYTSAQSVTLTSSKPGTIYYTTDDSDPTTIGGTRKTITTTGQVSIPITTTLKYYAVDSAGNIGYVATQVYTIIPPREPDAPTAPTATAGNAQATVSFSAPAFNGGSAITGYTVTSSPAGGTDINAGTTATTHTITGLTNGSAYTFTVSATNAIGTGADSTPSSPVTPITVPGAPTGVSATAGNAQATVYFTAPASDGGSGITSFTVTSSSGLTATGNASPITFTGLTNGTTYTFTVRANNVAGPGAVSASASVTPIQKAGDCNGSSTVTVDEVQSAINMYLGIKVISPCVDLNNSLTVTVDEVQKVINAFLGM